MRKDAGKPSVDTWTGLYKSGWQKVACVEAFSHPAKFARGLIQYIYQHAIEEGFLVPGNTVLDVFAGTALGAYDAMTHGMHFVGVELEQPFHDIGSGCDCTGISKADWVRFYGRWPRMRYAEDRYWCPQCLREAGEMQRSHDMFTMSASYVRDVHTKDNKATFATRHTNHPSGQIPTTRPHRYSGNLGLWARKGYAGARLIRGDSRELGKVLAKADCLVSSPPYADGLGHYRGAIADQKEWERKSIGATIYGQHPAQLGNLPPGSVDACLSSPPYAKGTVHDGNGIDWSKARHPTGQTMTPGRVIGDYGTSSAQLGNLPPGSVADAIVSSPPYAEGGLRTGGLDHPIQHARKDGSSLRMGQSASTLYGQHPAQLGNLPPGSVTDAILSSPPYANGCAHTGGADPQPQHIQGGPLPYVAYGQDASQLGAMPLGSLADAIVSSPPYADTPCRTFPTATGSRGEGRMTEAWQQHQHTAVVSTGYGTSPGQLAALPTGEVAAAVVSSPPHGGTTPVDGRAITDAKTHTRPLGLMSDLKHGYGESAGQLANDTSTTFWSAATHHPRADLCRPSPRWRGHLGSEVILP